MTVIHYKTGFIYQYKCGINGEIVEYITHEGQARAIRAKSVSAAKHAITRSIKK